MKKIIISLIFILIIAYILIIPTSKAVSANANITFNGKYTCDTVELTITTGNFEGFTTGGVVNIEMSLDYDSSIVSKITADVTNNWKVDLQENTKRVLISTDNSTDNVQIAKITFTLNKANLKPQEQTISIKDFIIANGGELTQNYPQYDYKFTPTTTTPTEPTDDEKDENKTENTNVQGATEQNKNNLTNKTNIIQGNKTDSTVAKTKLPAAGMGKAIAVAILGIVVLAIIFKIKSRKIKY